MGKDTEGLFKDLPHIARKIHPPLIEVARFVQLPQLQAKIWYTKLGSLRFPRSPWQKRKRLKNNQSEGARRWLPRKARNIRQLTITTIKEISDRLKDRWDVRHLRRGLRKKIMLRKWARSPYPQKVIERSSGIAHRSSLASH